MNLVLVFLGAFTAAAGATLVFGGEVAFGLLGVALGTTCLASGWTDR